MAKKPPIDDEPPIKRVKTKASQRNPNGTLKPGHKQSVGNRGHEARQLKRFLSAIVRDMLLTPDPKTKRMRAEIGIQAMLQRFDQGDPAAFKEIFDRIEGKATQAVELTGKEGKAITVINAGMSADEAQRAWQDTITAMAKDDDD